MGAAFRAARLAAAWGLLAAMVAGFGGGLVYDLDVLAHFRLHLILGALALVLLGGGWAVRGPLLGAALLGLAGLGPVWAAWPPVPTGAAPATVVFANGYSRNTQAAGLDAALVAAGADVVATVEMPVGFRDAPTALNATYPHRLQPLYGRRAPGVVVWSRWPLVQIPVEIVAQDRLFGAAVRVAAPVPFTLVAVHASQPLRGAGAQAAQIAALAAVLPTLPGPVVLGGDFNATPWSHAMAAATAGTDLVLVGGLRLTWFGRFRRAGITVAEPLGLPIDHGLVSPGVGVAGADLIDLPGSDHRGLVLRLGLAAP